MTTPPRHARRWAGLAPAAAFLLLCIGLAAGQSSPMTGPPVPAAWRDKGSPGTVAAVLNLTAPRLGELTEAQGDAIKKALLATLASDVPGLDVRRIKQQGTAAPVVVDGGKAGAGSADRMRVAVDLVAQQARLSDLLRRMQAVSDNAELAGSLRANGFYDLGDARFDSYELRAGGKSVDGKEDKQPPQDGGAVIELPPLPPLPKPVPVPVTPAPAPAPAPPPPPPPAAAGASDAAAASDSKAPKPVTAGIEVSGTSPTSADPTPDRQAALARAVAVLAGVNADQVKVELADGRGRRRRLLQDEPWARRFRVAVTPADAAQAATAKAALERLATPAGAADLRAALASQGWDGLTGAGITAVNGKRVRGAGTGLVPDGGGGGGAGTSSGGGGGGKIAGIVIGCLVGATLLGLAVAYALAHFLGWCRCLGAGYKGSGEDEEKAGGATTKKPGGGGFFGRGARPAKHTTDDTDVGQRDADLKAAAAAAAAAGEDPTAATAAVADDARRDLASIAAAGVTSLRRLASGAKDRAARPGSAGGPATPGVSGARGGGAGTAAAAVAAATAASAAAAAAAARARAAGGDPAATADAVMDFVRSGAPLAGAFALDRGALTPRGRTVTVGAREVGGARRPATATFFADDADYTRAAGLGARLPDGECTPAVLAAYGRGDAPGAPGLPPVIVREAADYSIEDWPSKRSRTPNLIQRKAVLAMTAKPLAAFAAKGLVHGALRPAAVQWFADANAMKLGGCDGWAGRGAQIGVHPVPAFAAPEVIAATLKADGGGRGGGRGGGGGGGGPAPTLAASPAQDAWSLGMLAYLILTDAHLIPPDADAADVAAALGSSGPLPWEKPGGALEELADPDAAAAIRSLLQREPKRRASAAGLLGGPLFKGLAAAAAAAQGTTGTPRRK